MGPFLVGFADELLKVSAAPQHERREYVDTASAVENAVSKSVGTEAKTGLKQPPVPTPVGRSQPAPTPMTTPNEIAGRVSGPV